MAVELRYFAGMSKGLGPALVAEYSGVPWKGRQELEFDAKTQWGALKPTTPFGQMPVLTLPDGTMLAQTAAIINYFGKEGGIEGKGVDYAISQMLLAEAEDIYQCMVKFMPTVTDSGLFFKLGEGSKGTRQDYDHFFEKTLVFHIGCLEKICAKSPSGFDGTPGGLFLFSVLYQLAVVKPDILSAEANGGETPAALAAWYEKTLTNDKTQKVIGWD